jgi:hypothetical protein
VSFICLDCIGDESLRALLSDSTVTGTCNFCSSNNTSGLEMEDLAEAVDETLREFCKPGEWRRAYNAAGIEEEQEGSSLVELLQEELTIDYDPAEELVEILEALEAPEILVQDGDEPFYDSSQNYHRTYFSSWPYSENWEEFSRRIKHRARFFDDIARSQLAEILGEPESAEANQLPALEVGPGTRVPFIYRARRAESDHEVGRILEHPAAELGPPQPEIATAGRMNPAGVSVFYGALSENTAISEVRPSVASLVVVGRFNPQRRLRLLDLSQIGIGFTSSIFHPNYANRAARLRFLEGFQYLIARPIQPRDEQLEYIPTQAVAEYVANVLRFDGILYASAQIGSVADEFEEPTPYVHVQELTDDELGQHNIVLFGEAAIVLQETQIHIENNVVATPSGGVLSYETNSARVVRVTGVNYSFEIYYVRNRAEVQE